MDSGLSSPDAQRERAYAADARRWFASWRAALWWLAPKRCPNGILHVLDDSDSRHNARKRIMRWLALPISMTALIAMLAPLTSYEFSNQSIVYDDDDPTHAALSQHVYRYSRRPFRPPILRDDRPCSRCLALNYPSKHIRVSSTPTFEKMTFRRTNGIDAALLLYPLVPGIAVLALYQFLRMIIRTCAARHAPADQCRVRQSAAATATSLLAPFWGLACWLWCLATLAKATLEPRLLFASSVSAVIDTAYLVAALWFVCTACLALPLLAKLDQGHVVFFRHWFRPALASVAAVGVVAIALYGCLGVIT